MKVPFARTRKILSRAARSESLPRILSARSSAAARTNARFSRDRPSPFRIASGTARANNASALEERKKLGKQERRRRDYTRTSSYVSGTFARTLSTCGVFSAAIMNHVPSRNHHRRARLALVNLNLADRLDAMIDSTRRRSRAVNSNRSSATLISRRIHYLAACVRLLFLLAQLQKGNNFLKSLHKSHIDGTIVLSSLDIELTSICIMIVQDDRLE